MSTTAEHPRDSVLDALAILLALDRGDTDGARFMVESYAASGELLRLVDAITGVALCSVRYAACAAAKTPEALLAGVAQEVRQS